jgi:mannose-6-phosphate isomerase-like protein (cupin superfamily)
VTRVVLAAILLLAAFAEASAQTPIPATDVRATDIEAFLNQLPEDVVSDRPIRVVDVGSHHMGVYGVLRPEEIRGDAILHEVARSETYYMLDGAGTLVTGGSLVNPRRTDPQSTSVRGDAIEGGVSRRVVPGDMVIIPGGTPHWWSELEGDIRYLIIRSDPDEVMTLR